MALTRTSRLPVVLAASCLLSVTAIYVYQRGGRLLVVLSEPSQQQQQQQHQSALPPAPDSDEAIAAALFHYLENPQLCCRKLTMFGGVIVGKSRQVDGDKLVCLDGGYAPPAGRCLVYSVGINNEWSFDRAMTRYGCQVHAFDPSMAGHRRNVTEFGARFYPIGLAGTTGTSKNGWHMMTLTDLRARLGHTDRPVDYLKVDIEGSEWEWLENDMSALENVRQLGMEVHLRMKMPALRQHYKTFRRLQSMGFMTVHSNANRVLGRHKTVPGLEGNVTNLYELVWVKV